MEACAGVAVFGVRRAVVVTQGFHMRRALSLARRAGLDVQGLTSDLQPADGGGAAEPGQADSWTEDARTARSTKTSFSITAGARTKG